MNIQLFTTSVFNADRLISLPHLRTKLKTLNKKGQKWVCSFYWTEITKSALKMYWYSQTSFFVIIIYGFVNYLSGACLIVNNQEYRANSRC